jgi:hypothetical protein
MRVAWGLGIPLAVLMLAPRVATAQSGWRDLAAHPERYIGKEVAIHSAYCGSAGDKPGYECSTDGALYIHASALAPAAAKTKLDEECGGIDWLEKSPSCRVRIRFVPRSYHASTSIEDNKTVLEIETAEMIVSF